MNLNDLTQPPHRAKILIALGMHRKAIVLSTDSSWVANEVDAIENDCDSIGILDKEYYDWAEGVYLWEGTLRSILCGAPWDGQEYETSYNGKLISVEPLHLVSLLEMHPNYPELELIEPKQLEETDDDAE